MEEQETLYLFKNEYEIQAYAGEVLTKRVGDIIVETIVSPTAEQLKDFGYKPLKNTERPVEKPGYAIETYYVAQKFGLISAIKHTRQVYALERKLNTIKIWVSDAGH